MRFSDSVASSTQALRQTMMYHGRAAAVLSVRRIEFKNSAVFPLYAPRLKQVGRRLAGRAVGCAEAPRTAGQHPAAFIPSHRFSV
jgi:hypothetical protein